LFSTAKTTPKWFPAPPACSAPPPAALFVEIAPGQTRNGSEGPTAASFGGPSKAPITAAHPCAPLVVLGGSPSGTPPYGELPPRCAAEFLGVPGIKPVPPRSPWWTRPGIWTNPFFAPLGVFFPPPPRPAPEVTSGGVVVSGFQRRSILLRNSIHVFAPPAPTEHVFARRRRRWVTRESPRRGGMFRPQPICLYPDHRNRSPQTPLTRLFSNPFLV